MGFCSFFAYKQPPRRRHAAKILAFLSDFEVDDKIGQRTGVCHEPGTLPGCICIWQWMPVLQYSRRRDASAAIVWVERTFYNPSNRPVVHASSPAAAPSNAPDLLRQDRAYQNAAAQFYSAQLDAARVSFQAIAEDAASPWRGIARYLVARTLVREAFLTATNGPDDPMAGFNPDLMKQAQHQLEAMRGEHLPGVSPHSAQSLLNLVRIRTETQSRLREMSAALAAPKTDPYYKQDLEDLTWFLNLKLDSLAIRETISDAAFDIKRPENDYRPLTREEKLPGFEKAFNDIANLRSVSPLIDWLVTFQSPSEAAKKHAIAEWKRMGGTPWLVAAIMKASSSDPAASGLPQKLQYQAGPGVGFHALMAILRNPGLRPYLDGGVQRSTSYDFVESYSDNWWCSVFLRGSPFFS